MATVLQHLPAPTLEGSLDAEVTVVGGGSTWGVLTEAVEQLNGEGISASHLQIKFLVPFHTAEVSAILGKSRRVIVVENNQSGQFARHLRAETGIAAHGHIRKYDGEPFEPKHIVAGVKELLAKNKDVVSRADFANNKYAAADPRLVTINEVAGKGDTPVALNFQQAFNAPGSPWLTLVRNQVLTGSGDLQKDNGEITAVLKQ